MLLYPKIIGCSRERVPMVVAVQYRCKWDVSGFHSQALLLAANHGGTGQNSHLSGGSIGGEQPPQTITTLGGCQVCEYDHGIE